MGNPFGTTLDLIRDFDHARTGAEIGLLLLKFSEPYGATNVLAGIIPKRGQRARNNVMIGLWPKEWSDRYFAREYIWDDPTISRVSSEAAPFFWDELSGTLDHNEKARRIMAEARDFSLVCGFTMSSQTIEGDVIGLSIAGQRFDPDPNVRRQLHLLGTYAIARALLLREQLDETPSLTLREQTILQWVATGRSMDAIGNVLGISSHGVDKHLRNVREKLDVPNTTAAIAKALRLRLIL